MVSTGEATGAGANSGGYSVSSGTAACGSSGAFTLTSGL